MRLTSLFLFFFMLMTVVATVTHTQHQHRDSLSNSGAQNDEQPQAETLVFTPKGQERPVVVEIAQVPELKTGAQRQSFKSFFRKVGRGLKKGLQVAAGIGKGLLGFRRLRSSDE
ncbi:hypothetical protein AC1031_022151 [Aphanomyces cochlioides]|nr:hypothetical protein AC1031_022151 [Aphanomyces cochlioides]